MPTRNQARWIEQAVQSVLNQEGAHVELLVMDALSDDGTARILERYQDRIVWRRAADQGQVDAIGRGFCEARGEIVAWLNSDDAYLPGAFARVWTAFQSDPELDFVYGDALEIDEGGRILTPNLFTEDCVADRYLCSHNFMCQPTVFFRRRVPARVGSLRGDLRWFMDYEWFTRFFKHGLRGRRLPHFLAANRDHPATKTNSGGFARWREAMRVFSQNPGPFLLSRRSIWIYSLEYVIKSLNAAGWAAPPELPAAQRNRRQRTVDRLNATLMQWIQPRSFDGIVRRFGAEIAPRGPNVSDLWEHASVDAGVAHCVSSGTGGPIGAPSSGLATKNPPPCPGTGLPQTMPAVVPLAPNLPRVYPILVSQMHEVMRQFMFPRLPVAPGRVELLGKLLGTEVAGGMYLLAELHETLGDPGDVCEFGVAQGATSALLANELRATGKTLWLFDSFAGLPKPSAHDHLKDDIFRLGSIDRYEGQMRCDSTEVEFRLAEIGVASDRYRVCAGWVQQTLRDGIGPDPVCFAYVDFDFYEPIAHALDYLDRHLTPNGRIVVDDYDFFSTGAKTAVDEFVAKHSNYELVLPAPFAGEFCMLRRKAG